MDYKESVEIVKKFLEDNDITYKMEDRGEMMAFTGELPGVKSLFSSFHYLLTVEDEIIQSFVTLPISAKEKLVEVSEFVARVNYPLKIGRLDLDFSDGEVRFHMNVPTSSMQGDATSVLAEVLALPGIVLMRYGKGIAEILFTGVDAKTAYEHCEA